MSPRKSQEVEKEKSIKKKKKFKTNLTMKDIKKELALIAQGGGDKNPFINELRVKSLKELAAILLKEQANDNSSTTTPIKAVTISVVDPNSEDQQKRLQDLEQSTGLAPLKVGDGNGLD